MNKNEKSLIAEVKKAAHTTVERMDFSAAYNPFSLDSVKMGNVKYAEWCKPSEQAMKEMKENLTMVSYRLYDASDSNKWKFFFPVPSPFGMGHSITQDDIDRLYLEDLNVSLVSTGGSYYLIPNREECTEWDVVRGYIALGRLPFPFIPVLSKIPDTKSVENAIMVEARIKSLELAKKTLEEQIDLLKNLYNAE